MVEYELIQDKYHVILSYDAKGRIKKIVAKRGVLIQANNDGHVFALLERDIEHEYWKKKQTNKDAFFTPAQRSWFNFFKKNSGFQYNFTVIDGKALKSIGQALTQITGNTTDAINTWQLLLDNWDYLPDYYKNKPQLKSINSDLNTILNLLKNGKQTGQAKTTADNYRSKI